MQKFMNIFVGLPKNYGPIHRNFCKGFELHFYHIHACIKFCDWGLQFSIYNKIAFCIFTY